MVRSKAVPQRFHSSEGTTIQASSSKQRSYLVSGKETVNPNSKNNSRKSATPKKRKEELLFMYNTSVLMKFKKLQLKPSLLNPRLPFFYVVLNIFMKSRRI